MPFTYQRMVHFKDTDAAGVVFFANYLALCHEAYEESLEAAGITLHTFFADTGTVVPISKSEANYHRPLQAGDKIKVSVSPSLLSEDSFQISYEIVRLKKPEKIAGRIRTEHVCIDSKTRARRALPQNLLDWVNAG